MKIQRFEEFVAWQRARALVSDVYAHIREEPARRDFTYRDQLCRAAISSMTNIAEGYGRRSRSEFVRFLDIARASTREVQSLLYIGADLQYLDDARFQELYSSANATAFLIGRLIDSLTRR